MRATILVLSLVLAGCGGTSNKPSAQAICEKNWTQKPTGEKTLTKKTMGPAADDLLSVSKGGFKNINGEQVTILYFRWANTLVGFNDQWKAVVAICDLSEWR